MLISRELVVHRLNFYMLFTTLESRGSHVNKGLIRHGVSESKRIGQLTCEDGKYDENWKLVFNWKKHPLELLSKELMVHIKRHCISQTVLLKRPFNAMHIKVVGISHWICISVITFSFSNIKLFLGVVFIDLSSLMSY